MDIPKRKHPRLKCYDYSQNGYYYVTLHAENAEIRFSEITNNRESEVAEIRLLPIGKVAEKQLFELENRYDYLTIDQYVIMPSHIHAILAMDYGTTSSRPSLTDIVCTYKSLTTRICNKNDNTPGRKIFQTSFYESIIRNEQMYYEVCEYIYENPIKWNLPRNLKF